MNEKEQDKESLPYLIELALAEGKLELAEALKSQLEENELRVNIFPNESEWQKAIQTIAETIAIELGYAKSRINFRVFVHGESDQTKKRWIIRDGTIPHIHYFGVPADLYIKEVNGKGKLVKPFWTGLEHAIIAASKVVRSHALEVRAKIWTMKVEQAPSWKRTIIKDEEYVFDLINDRNLVTDHELTITKSHKRTGIKVTVSGKSGEWESMNREAQILVSQKVFEFDEANERGN